MPPFSQEEAGALVSEIKDSIARLDAAVEVLAVRSVLCELEQSIDRLVA